MPRRAAGRRTPLAPLAGLAALALLAAGCSGADGDTPEEPSGPRVVGAAIERVDPAEGDPLWAGAGESRLEIGGVAGDGASIVAAGSRLVPGADAVPELLRSADGREWALVELPAELAAGVEFVDVVDAGEAFLVVGNRADGSGAVGVRTDGGGEAAEAVEVAFPVPDGGRPVQVRAVLAAGDRLYAAGVSAVGTVDEPTHALARLVVLTSDDAGATWSALDLPEEMSVLATGAIVLESAAAGGAAGDVSLATHDGTPFVVTAVPGAEGTVTSIWRGDDAGAEWTALGTADELFDGQVLDLLHGHGGDLLAFTRAGTDTALWRSDDDGGTFERVETDPAVFGGGGQQVVDAATTTDDGSLVVVGGTRGDPRAGRVQGELEVWVTADLETWNRSLTDPALGGYGGQRAAGVVPMGAGLVVVGTHERSLTEDDDQAFEDAGQRAIAAPMQHGVAWIVTLEDTAPADPGLDVAPLEVSGFDGEISLNGLTAFEGGLIAVGSVEVSRPSSDEGDDEGDENDDVAAVWTSADGAAWTRVESPALAEPAGQVINDVVATDAGLVAVGYTTEGEEDAMGVWTSADGAAWTRVELGTEFQGAEAYAVTAGPDGLVAVGTSSPEGRGYRDVGVWTSADAGQSWQVLPTTDEPFQAHDIELLSGVAVTEDGAIVAAGHSGTAEQRPGSGYSYSPVPYVVESADGQEWSVVEAPYGETDNGQADLVYVDSAAGEADVVTVAGSVNAPTTYPVGSFALSQSGLSRRVDGEWQAPAQRFRHRTWLRDWDDGVVVGEWHRGPGGSDALIAGIDGDTLVPVTDADVIAEGDQTASVAARLGDDLVVLGSDTTDGDVVIGWRVTTRSPG